MPLKKCVRATVKAPSGNGTLMPFAALTRQSSYVWHGETFLNQVYAALKKIWNMAEAYFPIVRINGISEGCSVIGDAVTNNVQITAGKIFVGGVEVTISADATIALTRPAASKYAVVALAAGADGTVDVIKGTDGDALDLSGGYGGAGQKPYVAVDHVCLAYITLYGDTAATVPQEDIYPGENANIPYDIDPMRGLVILGTALELNHTGGVSRGVYAQYYTQQDVMAPIGELVRAELDINVETVDVTKLSSDWRDYEEALRNWKVNYEKFKENQYFFRRVVTSGDSKFFVEIKEKSTDTFHYLGLGILTNLKVTLERGPMKEPLSMLGCGELVEVQE